MNILVIAPQNDKASLEVMDWLYHLGATRVFKYSFPDLIYRKDFEILSRTAEGKIEHFIYLDKCRINAIWFWRDEPLPKKVIGSNDDLDNKISPGVNLFLKEELNVLRRFLFENSGMGFRMLSNSTFMVLNKLSVLQTASEVGIGVPDYIICNTKADVIKFKNKHKRIITKPLSESLFLSIEGVPYCQYTEEVSDDFIDEMPEVFFPSLFQRLIDKDFEIRTFFLAGEFYSMAIFSQQDEQTSVDFRRYNTQKWNRNVPYKLPSEFEDRLRELMNLVGLNTGSIDILKDKAGKYYFLEVNPNGQFGMVSKPCNYQLEKKIASYLLNI